MVHFLTQKAWTPINLVPIVRSPPIPIRGYWTCGTPKMKEYLTCWSWLLFFKRKKSKMWNKSRTQKISKLFKKMSCHRANAYIHIFLVSLYRQLKNFICIFSWFHFINNLHKHRHSNLIWFPLEFAIINLPRSTITTTDSTIWFNWIKSWLSRSWPNPLASLLFN